MMKKAISLLLVLVFLFELAGCSTIDSAKEKASEVGKQASEKAESIVEDASEEVGKAKDYLSEKVDAVGDALSNLSLPDFKRGFEITAGYFGATIASLGGQTYVNNVAEAIDSLQQRIVNRVDISKTLASNSGEIAEEWHAGTYNIDAAAKGKNVSADTPISNGLASSDIVAGDTTASVKYYQNAQASATQQAKNYIQRYNEYASKATNPKPIGEWLADNKISIEKDSDLYFSIYKDQLRIVPADQLEGAKRALEKAIAKESGKDSATRKFVSDADKETLKNLSDRLKTADGTESVPLTKADAEALTKAAREGDIELEKFGLTLGSSIKGSYIAKQAIKSGATAATIEAAIVLGPEIYEIIKLGIENGELDEEQLKHAGIDGLTAAGDGFLKGSISNALVIMCQAGKLGQSYVNASPELIGTLTVLIIDAIRYGILLCNGEISTATYLDTMAEEVFVSAGALGTALLIGQLFSGAALAIILGSFVGGLVASAGYTTGKTFVLAWIEDSDIDLLVPIKETSEAIKDIEAFLLLFHMFFCIISLRSQDCNADNAFRCLHP